MFDNAHEIFETIDGKKLTIKDMNSGYIGKPSFVLKPTTTCFICKKKIWCLCGDKRACIEEKGAVQFRKCNREIGNVKFIYGIYVVNHSHQFITNKRLIHTCTNLKCRDTVCKMISDELYDELYNRNPK